MKPRCAIIFGGSRGIGRIIARHLARQGYHVTVAARGTRALHALEKESVAQGLPVRAVRADVTREGDVARVFNSLRIGPPSLVINCAAQQGPIGSTWKVPLTDFKATVNTNLIGSLIVTRAAIRSMQKRKTGSILLFSGGGAVAPRPGLAAYGTSKAGLLRLVETVAAELKAERLTGIVITAVAPGGVSTTMTEQILNAGKHASETERREAKVIRQTGGTPPDLITSFVDFMCVPRSCRNLSGRLVHVREDYRSFDPRAGSEAGTLRRIPL